MKTKIISKYLLLSVLLLLSLFNIGCQGSSGGGGAAPSEDYNPASVLAPNSDTIATEGQMFSYLGSAELVSLRFPVDDQEAYFVLSVSNLSETKQSIEIRPESYLLPSMPAQLLSHEHYIETELDIVRANTEAFRQKLANIRHNSLDTFPSLSLSLRGQSTGANHSDEKIGDIVNMWIISDSSGYNYSQRKFKLKKISNRGILKIFVDQEPHKGLDATKGTHKVTDSDIEHFAKEFDEHIYDLLSYGYGEVFDIDQDGALSLVISPIYASLGFAGLFNSKHMNPSETNSNKRDMIAVWSPNGDWKDEKWLSATRETIAHEMQHIVNYSARCYKNGIYTPAQMETVWLDEGLSVGVEARYRIRRNESARENRFDAWAKNPSSVGITEFTGSSPYDPLVYEKYGINGIYNLYLWEQGGDNAIKSLVQSALNGIENINNAFANRNGMKGIFSDWTTAIFIEGLRNKLAINQNKIDSKYKYNIDLSLPFNYTQLDFGRPSEKSFLKPYATLFFLIRQPKGFKASQNSETYRFRVESDVPKDLSIRMMRLPLK